jgi:hypothetical protein
MRRSGVGIEIAVIDPSVWRLRDPGLGCPGEDGVALQAGMLPALCRLAVSPRFVAIPRRLI